MIFDIFINFIETLIIVLFVFSYLQTKEDFKTSYIFPLILINSFIISMLNFYNLYDTQFIILEVIIIFLFTLKLTTNNNIDKITGCILPYVINTMVNYLTILFIASFIFHSNSIQVVLENQYFWIVTIISKVMFILVSLFIVKSRKNYDENLTTKEAFFLLFTLIVVNFSYTFFHPIIALSKLTSLESFIIILVLSILLITVLSGFFYFLKEKSTFLNQRFQNQLLESEIKRNHDIKNIYRETSKIKHDITHILDLIKINIQDKKYEEANIILNKFTNKTLSTKKVIISGNSIIDYYSNNLIERATENNIEVKSYISIKEQPKISDNELSILIGNLFDNALEHCGGEDKLIELNINNIKNHFSIELKNSISDDNKYYSKYLISRKSEKNHGIGTKSIIQIVENHKGIISFDVVDSTFICKILIPQK